MSTTIRMSTSCLLIFLCAVGTSTAQRIQWSEGTVELTDGSSMKGLISYNRTQAVLSFKATSDAKNDDAKYYSPYEVVAFRLLNNEDKKWHQYYSLQYEDPAIHSSRPVFFELLHQSDKFALLSKLDIPDKTMKYVPGAGIAGQTVEVTTQVETVFFADETGAFKPYLEISFKSDRILNRTKGKIIDAKLFQEYTQPYTDVLLDFAKKQNLDLNSTNDLVLILEQHKKLIEENKN